MLGFVSVRGEAVREPGVPVALTALHTREDAVIESVCGSDGFRDRLRSVGIVPGAAIRVLRRGCPVVVHVDGGRFSLRRKDAARISVTTGLAEAA